LDQLFKLKSGWGNIDVSSIAGRMLDILLSVFVLVFMEVMMENLRKSACKKYFLILMAAATALLSPVQNGFAAANPLLDSSPVEVSPVGDFEGASSSNSPYNFMETAFLCSLDISNDEIADDEYHKGWTKLHFAAGRGEVSKVIALIDRNADVNAAAGTFRSTPLIHACEEGRLEVVSLLLAANANYKLVDHRKWTPLHWASLYNHLEIVQILLNVKADINARTILGLTPIHAACSKGSRGISSLKLLIDSNASVEDVCKDGFTPLHCASASGNLAAVVLLLESRAGVSAVDVKWRTPLFHAVAYGNIDVVRLLLCEKADVGSKDKKNKTAFYFAELKGHSDIASLLNDAQVSHCD
jgi:ankyrin repeat protein